MILNVRSHHISTCILNIGGTYVSLFHTLLLFLDCVSSVCFESRGVYRWRAILVVGQ